MSPADDAEDEARLAALERTVTSLRAALDEAQASAARGRQFLADAASQLRGPVGDLHTGVGSLLRGPGAGERERLLANVVRDGTRGARLVTSLLRLASIDEGERLEPAPCDLALVCADEADRVLDRAPHLDVLVEVGQRSGDLLWLDERAVREMLSQLLDNARRHAASRIVLSAAGAGGTVEVRVGDDGVGLPAGLVERAFERFASLDGLEGAGLGLPIARDLARLHGGDLGYADGVFVLRLPG